MTRTRTALLENFDEEVREKLKLRQAESREQLSRFTRLLMNLTRIELGKQATFETDRSFTLHSPRADVPPGRYLIPSRNERLREQDGPSQPGEHRYRLGHPLAQHLLERAKSRSLALEVKAQNEMGNPEVLEKAWVAREWCEAASKHVGRSGGKPWRYAVIPHSDVALNKTLPNLTGSG